MGKSENIYAKFCYLSDHQVAEDASFLSPFVTNLNQITSSKEGK